MVRIKQFIAGLLAGVVLTVGGVRPALAADKNVDYVGGAESFVFVPAGDLFGSMKQLVPGAVVSESIGIGNRTSTATDLYLTSTGSPEQSALLSQLTLRIALVTSSGSETELYNGVAAGSTGGMVHLGRYGKATGATLVATLTVPSSLGNEFQDAVGDVVWSFTAVEYHPPIDDDDDDDDDDNVIIVNKPTATAIVNAGAAPLPATGRG